jgi:hypothetical protein
VIPTLVGDVAVAALQIAAASRLQAWAWSPARYGGTHFS